MHSIEQEPHEFLSILLLVTFEHSDRLAKLVFEIVGATRDALPDFCQQIEIRIADRCLASMLLCGILTQHILVQVRSLQQALQNTVHETRVFGVSQAHWHMVLLTIHEVVAWNRLRYVHCWQRCACCV